MTETVYRQLEAYPYTQTGEHGVLSSALQNPGLIMPQLASVLSEDDFYSPGTRILWGLMLAAYNTGKPIEPTFLIQTLMDRDLLEKVGGPAQVTEIYGSAASWSHWPHYLEEVKDKARRRAGLDMAECLRKSFMDCGEEWLPGVENVEAQLMTLRSSNSSKGLRTGRAVVVDLISHMEAAYRFRANPMGLSLGFPDIDRVVCGLQPQEFMIIAARPGMGKTSAGTAFAEAIALDAANKANSDVLMITLEMADTQIMRRTLLSRARIALSKGKTGLFSAAEGMVWQTAAAVIEAHPAASVQDLQNQMIFAAVDALEVLINAKAERATREGKSSPHLTPGMLDDYHREIRELTAAIAGIVTGKLNFYDGYGVTTQEIRAVVRDWVRKIKWTPEMVKQNCKQPLVILDYIQLVNASGKKAAGDPVLTITETCSMLKGLAKEMAISICGLAQVARGAEENTGRIPMLSNLKGGSALEEYADIVAFIHRDCYYKPWDMLKEQAQEEWEGLAAARNNSNDARTLKEPTWDGESYYNAHAVFAIRKGRDCAHADLDILFRGEFARFASKTAHPYCNNPADRHQPSTYQEDEF
jgi:replicative DNA helicase